MTGGPDSGFRRVLGPVDATCVVIGAIVGVGIFFTPSQVARMAGGEGLALVIWCLGGAVALLGALTFAELGRAYPRAGGQYDILRDAYGALPAFLYVFCNLTAIQAGAVAIIAVITADNLGVILHGQVLAEPVRSVVAHALIWGLTLVNVLGVRQGASIQNATVYAKMATLAAITVLAAVAGGGEAAAETAVAAAGRAPAPLPPAPEGFALVTVLFAGIIPTMFSYGGWQQALWMGGEIRDPERNVPRAIIVGVVLVVLVYVSASWAYFRLLGYEQVAASEALAADAVESVWGDVGRRAVAAAVAFSAFGVLNAQFLTGPRLTWAMARDGRFFAPFARLHPKTGTPVPAIVLLAALSSGLLLVAGRDGVNDLTAWVVVIDALFFALTGWSLIVHWRKREDLRRRPAAILVAAGLFGAMELFAVVASLNVPEVRNATWYGLAWIAGAAAIYGLFFARWGEGDPDRMGKS